jgi:hypothetical protein
MKLQEGNVIKLEKGMKVKGLIPEKFIYDNRKLSNKLSNDAIVIGEVYENDINIQPVVNSIVNGVIDKFSYQGVDVDRDKVVKFVKANVDNQEKETFVLNEGEFVVIKTTFDGGGSGHNDTYPDGHHVFCKALKNGEYDENGVEVEFYQSGSFNCMIEDITPIRNMKKETKWSLQ